MSAQSDSAELGPGGLPGIRQALAAIQALIRQDGAEGPGVIAFIVKQDTGLLRLSPESLDRLHRAFAQRLRETMRAQDTLYAIDRREGLIVLPGLRSSATLTLGMLRVREAFELPELMADGMSIRVEVACGASIYPDDGEDALFLVQSARIAALTAAQSGCGSTLYDPDMEAPDARLKALDGELRVALASESGLGLYLQPQVAIADGHCLGAEALLRWQRANGERVAPIELLTIIDRLGLRQRFIRWLFSQAARTARELANAGIAITLSINLSANDLLDPEVPDLFEQSLRTWNVAPAAIRVEITETSMVQETDAVMDVLWRFQALGTSVSIDDFGTGFSGMSNLKNLPVSEVKIDRSFITHLLESRRDQEIVASIIALSHRLGLHVLAEGVEREETARLLVTMGCDWAQGFLYSPALSLNAFIAWHRAHRLQPTGLPF